MRVSSPLDTNEGAGYMLLFAVCSGAASVRDNRDNELTFPRMQMNVIKTQRVIMMTVTLKMLGLKLCFMLFG